MKANCFLRQITIAVLIVALFSIGLFLVMLLRKDAPVSVLSIHDFKGTTAVVYTSEGKSTGANGAVYSLGDQKYLALWDDSVNIALDGSSREVQIARNGDTGEITNDRKKETRPLEKMAENEENYEFFGGEISFYPFEQGWISVIVLMNHADNAGYECVRFGNVQMTAKEYHDAFADEGSLVWDAEKEVYLDEFGQAYETRSGYESEVPVLYRTQEKNGYVSFYLTDKQYESLMEEKIFALRDAEGGEMNVLFWEKE